MTPPVTNRPQEISGKKKRVPSEAIAKSQLITHSRPPPTAQPLIAPTTGEARIKLICENAGGYIYYVSFKGVTGAASLDTDALAGQIEPIRRATDLPIGVGFGVRTPDNAAAVADVADGVVVGSVLVGQIAAHLNDVGAAQSALSKTLGAMRAAIDTQDSSRKAGQKQEGEHA